MGGRLLDLVQADDTTTVPVQRLTTGYSPRRRGLDPVHVERLTETGGGWPPILVQRSTMRVIDGAHRLAAAGALHLAAVTVTFFDGDDDEARVEAIRANRGHGLPLSHQDRKDAAADLLGRHADWSDGRIAEVCSLSPKTVGGLRRRTARPTGEAPESDSRIGRDGRRHPANSSAVRARISEAITDDPGASLRQIAGRVHASPETVRTVRRSLQGVSHPRPVLVGPLPTIDPELIGAPGQPRWSCDSACASTADGARFAEWFDRHGVDEAAMADFVAAVPVSRSYEVADEAHRRARLWATFADRLERQLRHATH